MRETEGPILNEEFVPWESFALLAISHACEGTQSFIRSRTLAESFGEITDDTPVLVEQRVYGISEEALIVTAALCSRVHFSLVGCECRSRFGKFKVWSL